MNPMMANPALAQALMAMPKQQNRLATAGSEDAYQTQAAPNMGLLQGQLAAEAQRRKMAEALQQTGYIPNSGPLGAVSQMASAWFGNKAAHKSDERISELMRQSFEASNAEEKRKAEIALQNELAKEDRAAARSRETEQFKFELDERRTPNDAKEARFFADHPDLAAVDERRGRSRASTTNITLPGQNYAKPFDEAMAKADVGMIDSARTQAMDAQRALASATQLQEVLNRIPAGKPQQFYGQMSQYFGGKAGADFQAQKALVEEQVNAILNAAKGPQTDQDAERARAQIPNMGTDPRAREIIFDYIKRKNESRIQEFQSMDSYARQHGNLQGYQPPVVQPRQAPVGGDFEATKQVGGKTYVRRNGQWFEQ